jgi:heme A synthase
VQQEGVVVMPSGLALFMGAFFALLGLFFVVLGLAEYPPFALLGLGIWVGAALVGTGAICTDVRCKYAAVTVERVNAACRTHNGVSKWGGENDVVCRDGTALWLDERYYHPGHPPRP